MGNYYDDECIEILHTLNYVGHKNKSICIGIIDNNNEFMNMLTSINDISDIDETLDEASKVNEQILYSAWIETTLHLINEIDKQTPNKYNSLLEYNIIKKCANNLMQKKNSI